MATQDERPSLAKRSLEDIAATQADHTLLLSALRTEMIERFDAVDRDIAQVKSTLALILDRLSPK